MEKGAEKAWDAKLVQLWLITTLIFGGSSIINRATEEYSIGLNCTQTTKGQATELKKRRSYYFIIKMKLQTRKSWLDEQLKVVIMLNDSEQTYFPFIQINSMQTSNGGSTNEQIDRTVDKYVWSTAWSETPQSDGNRCFSVHHWPEEHSE